MSASLMRSLLYVPANRPDLVAKMGRFAPDAVVIDLEDGTPEAHKSSARPQAADAARELRKTLRPERSGSGSTLPPAHGSERIWPPSPSGVFDGWWCPKWRQQSMSPGSSPRWHPAARTSRLMWGFETVLGVHRCHEVLAASSRGIAAYFGAEDYVTDLGGQRTRGSLETLMARSTVAMAARRARTHCPGPGGARFRR